MPLPVDLVRRYEMGDAGSERCCWRVMPPRWSSRPLSGEGAAINGGRWNRVGRPALYLSKPPRPDIPMAMAWAEYQQGIGTRIGTLAPYELVMEAMADLTDPDVLRPLMMNVEDLRGDWRSARIRGEVPMTWNVVEMLIANGGDAIRVCLVAEHCWDPVQLAIVEHAWRFKRLIASTGQG